MFYTLQGCDLSADSAAAMMAGADSTRPRNVNRVTENKVYTKYLTLPLPALPERAEQIKRETQKSKLIRAILYSLRVSLRPQRLCV